MFPLFTSLPPELRARIWELTVEPRRVDIAITGYTMTSSAAAPAALQACPEARHHLQRFCGYRRLAYFKRDESLRLLDAALADRIHNEDQESKKMRRRTRYYVWVNLDVDMIDIGEETCVVHFEPIGHLIRRLRLVRDVTFEGNLFEAAEKYEVKGLFPNVEEVYLVCAAGIEDWEYLLGDLTRFWACPREHLYLLDYKDMPGRPYKRQWYEDGMRFVRAMDLEDEDDGFGEEESETDGSEGDSETDGSEEERLSYGETWWC